MSRQRRGRDTPGAKTVLSLHVQPGAAATEVVGWHGDAVKVRVRAPPADGAANDELVAFLAAQLGLPRTAVRIRGGAASRRKRITIEGLRPAQVLAALGLTD